MGKARFVDICQALVVNSEAAAVELVIAMLS